MAYADKKKCFVSVAEITDLVLHDNPHFSDKHLITPLGSFGHKSVLNESRNAAEHFSERALNTGGDNGRKVTTLWHTENPMEYNKWELFFKATLI